MFQSTEPPLTTRRPSPTTGRDEPGGRDDEVRDEPAGISVLSLPQQLITVVPIDKDAPGSENWFHGRLDRAASERRLREAGKLGGFLLRESERKSGSFVLSYLSLKCNAYHFK
jgi:Ras GTPase-activating protein 1